MSLNIEDIASAEFENKRLNYFMRESLPHYIGTIFVAVPFFSFILHQTVIKGGHWIWLAFDVPFLMLTLAVYYKYSKDKSAFKFSIGVIPIVYMSFYLALAPWLFLDTNESIYYLTLIVMMISIAATSAYAFAYYLRLMAMILIVPLGSLFIRIFYSDIENAVAYQVGIIWLIISALTSFYILKKKFIRTISLQMETDQARKEAEQANHAKSKFLAAASHDIRQPLQAVVFFLETLKDRNRDPSDEIIYQRLESSVESMSGLLNDLLDISKLDADSVDSKEEHFSLTELCDRLLNDVHPSAENKSLRINKNLSDLYVFGDSTLLDRVLKNLLSNAVQYTNLGEVTLSSQRQSETVLIQVKDTGIGIPESDHQSIFDEFHQLQNPERDSNNGLGLGLAIVKRLCDHQNWPLTLVSDSSGSCFSVEVPLGDRNKVVDIIQPKITGGIESIRALIIDDDEAICHSLVALFKNWGSEVEAFDCAQAAEDFLLANLEWRPNLLISDYRLRENKTGAEAIRQIHGVLGEEIPALIITGDTDPIRIKEAEASGFAIIHKPIKAVRIRTFILQRCKHLIS
jgi:signal transduction histidine kinase/CheY-like chemotaxis protein